ncbi:MAG: FAD-dependent oxidoreductase [Synergistaceae bacterium]|jgi:NADH-quinone oxidoreductase subunit F|nr:FAD-dependent oxidoreductase [Synergistaceae bacterium]
MPVSTDTIRTIGDLEKIRDGYKQKLAGYKYQALICGGAGCVSSGCAEIRLAVEEALAENGIADSTVILETGCIGTCSVGPVMLISPGRIFYTNLTPEKARKIVKSHLLNGEILKEHTFFDSSLKIHVPHIDDIEFFSQQVKIALRNCGEIDHSSIEAYIARDGYFAAANYLTGKTGADVVGEVKKSGLMGRGGAGFPTGIKWEAGRNAPGEKKFVVCNADEGDPGAFMDRSLIEGDPHSLIEGMMMAGYAIGANMGFAYVRAEYPLAIERLDRAIKQARECGLLGDDIFGSGFSFDLEIRIGAGAFVCGEETALMNSIEGERGEPHQKPPFPFQEGLFKSPTIINNVETLANIPAILLKGADWYTQYGTETSKGTKVFALAGNIANTGMLEVPIGIPIGDILFNIGGGVPGGKKFKAAQIGGPSGGCLTTQHLNTPTDYGTLKKLGAIMGSGGLIAMNEDTCMVDTARFFMDFIQDESCGKCVACRIGTKRMLEILERITAGNGMEGDIELLEELGETVQEAAMCGLGQTAPNPVLSAIKNFREEFDEHIKHKYCRAGVCSDLFVSPCENACPAHVNVPGYTSLVAEGRFVDAYNLIRQENPFPAVCGRVCTRPCESKCRRSSLDEAVAICDIKRFIADYAFNHEKPYTHDVVFPKNGKRIAIIGAGAAGLTCGYYLARIGYEVNVYEAEEVAGGVLAFGIPEYRLPKTVLQHEIDLIKKEGVNIHLGVSIGREIGFNDLKHDHDAVFVAIGTQFPQRINIEGENLPGVIHGITFLKMVNLRKEIQACENVVVIGGGNTAVDSARTAIRLGAKYVTLLYRRTKDMMPAYASEVEEAIAEGVELVEMVQPVKIVGSGGRVSKVVCSRMELGEFDSSGRRRSVHREGLTFELQADLVIPAISQHADLPFVSGDNIGLTPWGTFTVDEDTMMTTQDGVFAGGDIIRGPDTVIQAIADGKKAAEKIDIYLGGRGILNKGEEIHIQPKVDEDEVAELKRYPLDMLPLDKRGTSFDEVVLGYHKLTAMAEAMRCLHCERR